jgi:hypothetical protein
MHGTSGKEAMAETDQTLIQPQNLVRLGSMIGLK